MHCASPPRRHRPSTGAGHCSVICGIRTGGGLDAVAETVTDQGCDGAPKAGVRRAGIGSRIERPRSHGLDRNVDEENGQ